MVSGDTLLPRVREAIADKFFLRSAQRIAAEYPAAGQDRMRELCRAANERARVAGDLIEGRAASAVVLYREAALLYAAALVTVRLGETLAEPLRAEEIVARFKELPADAFPQGGREAAETFLSDSVSPDLLAADRLETPRAVELGYETRRAVRRLADLVEPRTVAEIKMTRTVRVGATALAALALLVYVISTLGSRENVALHKPVSVSGLHPAASSPPSGLTDGVKSGAPYGVHTSFSDAPWVQVDLEALYEIDTVKVYNRGDGWYDEGLPMTLQFSENGRDFVDVETRTTSFGQSLPWTAKTGHRPGRYVRIRGAKGRYVTLSELEVFGRRK